MADKQAVLGNGAKFTGKITNAKSIEINGVVQADLVTEKVTIGSTGNATDFGDLITQRRGLAGYSNGHGGLS